MAWAFELYLDQQASELVRAVSDHGTEPAQPHISLGVADAINESLVRDLLSRWVERERGVSVRFDHWGLFVGDTAVLFLAPSHRDLLDFLHRSFFEIIGSVASGYWEYYTPARWIPHCTVAERVPLDELRDATERARRLSLPLEAKLDRLALVEFRPGRHECLLLEFGG